jgi:shikimate dehydrogenase
VIHHQFYLSINLLCGTKTWMSKQEQNMKNLSPNGSTKFCFLMGSDIANTRSPALHTAWFVSLNLNAVYLPCSIQGEESFKNTFSSLLKIGNFCGANITMPFKSLAVEMPDLVLSHAVKAIGAANTLYKNKEGGWSLENTDIIGIKKTIESLVPRNTPYNMILLGGGGAAASCIHYAEHLDSSCQQVICLTRNPEKTKGRFPNLKTGRKLRIFNLDLDSIDKVRQLVVDEALVTLVVNTIPDTEKDLLVQIARIMPMKNFCYFDMLYKNTTVNLEFARSQGIPCVDGLLMLEEQAKESFFLWTGIRP